jgi:hypothetical protein
MEITVDTQIVKMFAHQPAEVMENQIISDLNYPVRFGWPSLLEYLDLGLILSDLPSFDQTHSLFRECVEVLSRNEEQEVLFHVYDHLFTENLKQVKALPQVSSSFLLQAIKERRQKNSFLETEKILSRSLDPYEAALSDKASHTIRDLILYLAWDRMCVWMGRLFDYQSPDPTFIKGIAILKECLIESYQHITQQGQTSPGIFRMLESLVFYQMREENLHRHTQEEWTLLSQSLPLLKPHNELVDFFYIDDALVSKDNLNHNHENAGYHLTLDSSGRVHSRLVLAQYLLDQIKLSVPDWHYVLHSTKMIYLNFSGPSSPSISNTI